MTRTMLVTRPAASIERKLIGAGAGGGVGLLAAQLVVAVVDSLWPGKGTENETLITSVIMFVSPLIGGYITKSRVPMPIKDVTPVES